jgi:hypothetical protein
MATLTQEQRQLLHQSGGEPVRLVDPETNQEYVLIATDHYEQLRALRSDLDPREFYPALRRALQAEGWDEPHMDEYNRYG